MMLDQKIKTKTAMVVSKSGDKSIKVAMEFKVKHPKYGKYVRRRTQLSVHDEQNKAGVGDFVEITECSPRSKTKSWRLVTVLKKATEQ